MADRLCEHFAHYGVVCAHCLAWVWLTGGLHLDGLADTADGFVGGHGDKTRTPVIMKDPNCGAMGGNGNRALLDAQMEQRVRLACNAAALAITTGTCFFGRLAILGLFLTTPYVRALMDWGQVWQIYPKFGLG